MENKVTERQLIGSAFLITCLTLALLGVAFEFEAALNLIILISPIFMVFVVLTGIVVLYHYGEISKITNKTVRTGTKACEVLAQMRGEKFLPPMDVSKTLSMLNDGVIFCIIILLGASGALWEALFWIIIWAMLGLVTYNANDIRATYRRYESMCGRE